MARPGRPGAGNCKKKGPMKGTGGHGRKSLEGKGPTPKAEDRSWHVAGKRKAAQERYAAAGGTGRPGARVGRAHRTFLYSVDGQNVPPRQHGLFCECP